MNGLTPSPTLILLDLLACLGLLCLSLAVAGEFLVRQAAAHEAGRLLPLLVNALVPTWMPSSLLRPACGSAMEQIDGSFGRSARCTVRECRGRHDLPLATADTGPTTPNSSTLPNNP